MASDNSVSNQSQELFFMLISPHADLNTRNIIYIYIAKPVAKGQLIQIEGLADRVQATVTLFYGG